MDLLCSIYLKFTLESECILVDCPEAFVNVRTGSAVRIYCQRGLRRLKRR